MGRLVGPEIRLLMRRRVGFVQTVAMAPRHPSALWPLVLVVLVGEEGALAPGAAAAAAAGCAWAAPGFAAAAAAAEPCGTPTDALAFGLGQDGGMAVTGVVPNHHATWALRHERGLRGGQHAFLKGPYTLFGGDDFDALEDWASPGAALEAPGTVLGMSVEVLGPDGQRAGSRVHLHHIQVLAPHHADAFCAERPLRIFAFAQEGRGGDPYRRHGCGPPLGVNETWSAGVRLVDQRDPDAPATDWYIRYVVDVSEERLPICVWLILATMQPFSVRDFVAGARATSMTRTPETCRYGPHFGIEAASASAPEGSMDEHNTTFIMPSSGNLTVMAFHVHANNVEVCLESGGDVLATGRPKLKPLVVEGKSKGMEVVDAPVVPHESPKRQFAFDKGTRITVVSRYRIARTPQFMAMGNAQVVARLSDPPPHLVWTEKPIPFKY